MSDFWKWFDKVTADALATEDGKAFAAAGLTVQHTGGGFVGWQIELGDKYVLVTDDDGTGLFTKPETEHWVVGLYEGESGECISFHEVTTVAEAIALVCDYRNTANGTA